MNNFRKISAVILIIEVVISIVFNIVMFRNNDISGRQYRVESERIRRVLESGEPYDVSDYETIIDVVSFDESYKTSNDYRVISVNGSLYSIEYKINKDSSYVYYANIALATMFIVTFGIFIYVDRKVLKPFHNMSNLAVELAKGNLSAPIKEEKSKFFGKFLWGMDMLRDNLETNKQKELELQKEKKTLILSLSHDIKTPLSAIKLYNKALSENLYDTEDKRQEALLGISKNTLEIERYVNEIVTASKEDFLNLEVNITEFYIDEVMAKIKPLYEDKFRSLHTEFKIESYDNVMLKGDRDRLEEVLQNLLENAIKYGDGKKVTISMDDEEDCRLIMVTNTGCTLKKEELPHLFDSFYRGANSEKQKGSGLGLYIAKTLMRLMNGEIYASIDEDKFTCVVVAVKA